MAYPSGSSQKVLAELRHLPEVVGSQDPERIQTTLVLRSGGDWDKFVEMRDLAFRDWSDALIVADLADDD